MSTFMKVSTTHIFMKVLRDLYKWWVVTPPTLHLSIVVFSIVTAFWEVPSSSDWGLLRLSQLKKYGKYIYQMLLVSPREWVGKGVDDHSRMGGGCTNCKRPPKKTLEIYCSSKPPFCNRMRAKSQKPISFWTRRYNSFCTFTAAGSHHIVYESDTWAIKDAATAI